jgi:hypothetical protein
MQFLCSNFGFSLFFPLFRKLVNCSNLDLWFLLGFNSSLIQLAMLETKKLCCFCCCC